MTTLSPLSTINIADPSKSKKSLSIYQSKRAIDDLQNSLEQEKVEEVSSSLLNLNRQVFSGITVDVKQFDQNSKIKKQVICRDGEDNEKIIFSFLTLEEQNGKAKKAIYRWMRKPFYAPGINHGVTITDEEHIYQGQICDNRKHGEGQYIIIRKLSNGTQKNIRYVGKWNYDIFIYGTVQDENGIKKQIRQSSISFKSKSILKGKTDRNATIKQVASGMQKKKDKSSKLICESISSNVSIAEGSKNKKSNRVVIL